ncbi:hypothetical protein MFRU_020g01270 [Monilinia fructicola]|nr:hypothetical protein MFRU_020g01270 [Monilinia fructicola]
MVRLIVAATLLSAVMACPDHDLSEGSLMKRAGGTDWSYDTSYDWGKISDDYTLCQTGAQQSPVHLNTADGLAKTHKPTFNYPDSISGSLYNWGYGPAFVPAGTDLTRNPSMTFDGETVYLKGLHIHSPSEHSINGDRAKSELHLVHAKADGEERAVVGILIDPVAYESNAPNSTFFESLQLSKVPSFKDTTTRISSTLNIKQALTEVKSLDTYWTYEGSLTTPPCTQGLRWFVSNPKLLVGTAQMQELLKVSSFSARVEQEVWGQKVNV